MRKLGYVPYNYYKDELWEAGLVSYKCKKPIYLDNMLFKIKISFKDLFE